MTDAIDLERMMVTIEGETTRLERDFSKAVSIVNTASDKMERRTDQLKTKIETQFSQAGSNAARRLTGALAAGLSFVAIESFVSHIAETTENIEKQSRALGVSTDAFQAWSLSAKHASIDQDTLNGALDFFSKNVGLAQLKVTPFGTLMKKLGVDIHAGPTESFYQFADSVTKLSSVQQRNQYISLAMGRSAVQMAAMLAQGSGALKAQADQFKANGEIIDKDAIDKINKLRVAWGDLKAELTVAGANVLTGIADEFGTFEGGIESPAFQSAMHQFGVDLAEVAKWAVAISNSPWFKYIAAGAVGFKLGGLPGAAVAVAGTAAYANRPNFSAPSVAEAQQRLAETQKALDDARAGKGSFTSPGSFTSAVNSYLPDNIREILDKINPNPAVANALKLRDAARKDLQTAQRAANRVEAIGMTPGVHRGDLGGGGLVDLSGALDKTKGGGAAKVSEYAKAVAELIIKTNELAKADDDSTEASAKAEASTRLLDAARADGLKITPALRKQIDDLSSAYARVNAARAFSKDLATEDDRIAKLKEEAKQAELSAAAIAEAEERAKLLSSFHDKFGKNAVPTPAQQTDIDMRAKAFGAETGADAFSKNVKGAQDENKALTEQIATIGLYGGALAEAQMRLTLINQAMQANGTVSAEDMAKITALAKAHGELTKQLEDEQQAEANRVAVTDELRTGLENIGVTGVTAFKDLKSAAGEFLQQLAQLIVKLYVMQPLLDSLLGKQGTSGGGLLGSLLGNILGSSAAPTVPGNHLIAGAGDLTANGLGDTGFFESLLSAIGLAEGGKVSGPGGPREDKVHAMLSDGEYVVNAKDAGEHGALLEAINSGDHQKVREIAAGYVGQRIAYDLGRLAPFLTDTPKARPRKFADGGRVSPLPSLPHFADGGMVSDGGGPRGFPSISVPKVQPASSHSSTVVQPVFNIDARGATEGTAAMIHKTVQGYIPVMLAAADKQGKATFPENARTFFRDRA